MKPHFVLFSLCIVLFATSCRTPKLVQKPSEIRKLEIHKEQFIGKSLKTLLEEINPPIKRVTATPSINIQSYVGNFHFYFMDSKAYDSTRNKGEIPLYLVVYVKEYFDWDFQKRPKGKETVWTAEDVKKYENLTIVGIRIHGG